MGFLGWASGPEERLVGHVTECDSASIHPDACQGEGGRGLMLLSLLRGAG